MSIKDGSNNKSTSKSYRIVIPQGALDPSETSVIKIPVLYEESVPTTIDVSKSSQSIEFADDETPYKRRSQKASKSREKLFKNKPSRSNSRKSVTASPSQQRQQNIKVIEVIPHQDNLADDQTYTSDVPEDTFYSGIDDQDILTEDKNKDVEGKPDRSDGNKGGLYQDEISEDKAHNNIDVANMSYHDRSHGNKSNEDIQYRDITRDHSKLDNAVSKVSTGMSSSVQSGVIDLDETERSERETILNQLEEYQRARRKFLGDTSQVAGKPIVNFSSQTDDSLIPSPHRQTVPRTSPRSPTSDLDDEFAPAANSSFHDATDTAKTAPDQKKHVTVATSTSDQVLSSNLDQAVIPSERDISRRGPDELKGITTIATNTSYDKVYVVPNTVPKLPPRLEKPLESPRRKKRLTEIAVNTTDEKPKTVPYDQAGCSCSSRKEPSIQSSQAQNKKAVKKKKWF